MESEGEGRGSVVLADAMSQHDYEWRSRPKWLRGWRDAGRLTGSVDAPRRQPASVRAMEEWYTAAGRDLYGQGCTQVDRPRIGVEIWVGSKRTLPC